MINLRKFGRQVLLPALMASCAFTASAGQSPSKTTMVKFPEATFSDAGEEVYIVGLAENEEQTVLYPEYIKTITNLRCNRKNCLSDQVSVLNFSTYISIQLPFHYEYAVKEWNAVRIIAEYGDKRWVINRKTKSAELFNYYKFPGEERWHSFLKIPPQ